MSETTSEATTEPVLERVAKVACGCTKPETCEVCPDNARAILLEVADAVEEAYRVAGPGDIEAHLQPAAHWIREQAAEEGADVDD